ncbi:MAG: adenylyltransferase/cytidyltransferase family protein [Candidatus Bathyarchaeia archaeon]
MNKRKTRVIASGVFDLIHYGHLKFLEKAKEVGGPDAELIVVVARDATVRKMKGAAPVLPEEQRCAIVEALKPVDLAILGHETLNIPAIIEAYKPDIIALGYDQAEIERKVLDYLKNAQLSTRVVMVGHFGTEDLDSSTKIKRKIVGYTK